MSIEGVFPNTSINITAGINCSQKKDIEQHIKGAVYCWLKNSTTFSTVNDGWLGISELLGTADDDRFWTETPLNELWIWHKNHPDPKDTPMTASGKDAGLLLKKVLLEDSHVFERTESKPRKYRLKQ
jgi:hypothetical protein